MKCNIPNKLNKIDVIIPYYNSSKTIDRCLSSICMQTIKDDLKVTIVNDCSTEKFDLSKIVERYSPIIDIQIVNMEQNGGPGLARQYGINKTNYPLMTFIDADDTFATTYSIARMRALLYQDYDNTIAAWTSFYEECSNGQFVPHYYTPTWMFGKLYKRSFWEEKGIHFHPTSRYNEDTGVNTHILLLSNDSNQKIARDKSITYYWMNGEKTITRNYGDVDDYWDNNCLIGYAENLTYILNKLLEEHRYDVSFQETVCRIMFYIWLYYVRAYDHKAYKIKECAEKCIAYYNEIYSKFEHLFTKQILIQSFDSIVPNVGRVNPYLTFDQFIQKCKNGTLINDINW